MKKTHNLNKIWRFAMQNANENIFLALYRDTANGKCEAPDSYNGLPIHSYKGLHQRAGELINQFATVNNAPILDIAAGSGAMSQRLIDQGANVNSIDIVAENFRVKHANCIFHNLNLNDDFSSVFTHQFNVIVALEIIEHINNTRHFIQNCEKLLKPGGILVLSTPNIGSDLAVAEFICKGTFPYFNNDYYYHGGHVNPVTEWQLKLILQDHNLKLMHQESFGNPIATFKGWPKLYLTYKLVAALRKSQNRQNGVINLFILTK
jgi:2-polyprenyl-3-methyl-5-hydroxy-6-metoxy-1,4-benzoquinol methylase